MVNGSEIRTARIRMRLSQQELADRVGVSLRTIGNWELGRTSPGAAEALLLDVMGEYLSVGGGEPRRTRFDAVTDAELLAEIARRFARSTEQREEGGGDDRNAASIGDLADEGDPPLEVKVRDFSGSAQPTPPRRRRRREDQYEFVDEAAASSLDDDED